MTRWLRLYPGTMRDPKFVSIALRTAQKKQTVVFVWGCILESASEMQERGAYRLDPLEVADFLDLKPIDITMILAGFEREGLVADGVVVNWAKRQFEEEREDAEEELSPAARRMRAYRARQNQRNGVTPSVTEGVTEGVTPASLSETDRLMTDDDARVKSRSRRSKTERLPGQRELFPARPIEAADQGSAPVPSDAETAGSGPQTVLVADSSPDEALKRRLQAAAADLLDPASKATSDLSALLARWRAAGCKVEVDVLSSIAAVRSRRVEPRSIRSWQYFEREVFIARDIRVAPVPPPKLEIVSQGGFVERGPPRKRTLVDALFDQRTGNG